MQRMVRVQPSTTATFFYVTDARSLDRTTPPAPQTGAVDSSGRTGWWYVPPAADAPSRR